MYAFARYCPRIPVQKNCTPLVIRMMHTREGQPDTGSPKISFRTMINMIIKKAMIQNSTPTKEAIRSGAVENAVIPSREYTRSFQKFHLVSPLARSTFSYSSHLVLKPTQPKIPLVKRLYYLMDRIASTICLVIRR